MRQQTWTGNASGAWRIQPFGPGETFGFRVSFPGGIGGAESHWSCSDPA
jgi:hypothetical protein